MSLAVFSKTRIEGGAPAFPIRGPLPAGAFSAQGRVSLTFQSGPSPCVAAVFGLVTSVSFGDGSSSSTPVGWDSPTGAGWSTFDVFRMSAGQKVYFLVPNGSIEVFASFVPPPASQAPRQNPNLLAAIRVNPFLLAQELFAAEIELAIQQTIASRVAQRPTPPGVRYNDLATLERLVPQYPTLGLAAAPNVKINAPPLGTVTWSGICYVALLGGAPQAGAYSFKVDQAPGG